MVWRIVASVYFGSNLKLMTWVHLSLCGHDSSFWWWKSLQSSPLSSTGQPSFHWFHGYGLIVILNLGALWGWTEFNLKLPWVPVLLWGGETFLPQIHLVTLIFLWFNLVFIPKVGAQRTLPGSQEYGRINEPLLGKRLELLRWNKQYRIF